MKKRVAVALIVLLICGFAGSSVSATENSSDKKMSFLNVTWENEYEDITEMEIDVPVVIRGKVKEQVQLVLSEQVYTKNVVEVLEVLKGQPEHIVCINQIGGEYGAYYTPTPTELPLLEIDKEYILFLKSSGTEYYIAGAGQGYFDSSNISKKRSLNSVIEQCRDEFLHKSTRAMIETPFYGYKWTKRDIYFNLEGSIYVMPSDATLSSISTSIRYWNYKTPKIHLYESDSTADINVYFTNETLPTGALADTSTVYNANNVATSAEIRVFMPRITTESLPKILCHEMGHALGLAHFDGTAPSVMYSYYNNCASSPQQVDIDGLNSLYS